MYTRLQKIPREQTLHIWAKDRCDYLRGMSVSGFLMKFDLGIGNHQIMTRKSGGVVMRVGPGALRPKRAQRSTERIHSPLFRVSSLSLFSVRVLLLVGPCGGARRFSSWSSWVINYGWDIGTSSCPFVRGT